MKQLLLLLATLLGLTTFSQTPFSIGINSSLDFTGLQARPNFVEPWIGYQLGVRLKYDLNQNFSLISGFNHQNQGSKADLSRLRYKDATDLTPISVEGYDKISQVPLLLSFYTGNKLKYGFNVGAAYSFSYRVNSHITYQDKNNLNKETKRYTTAVSSQFISGLFSFGVEYNLNRTTFRVEPNMAYNILDVTSASINYLNLGLGASVYYRLK
ncbi:MAG: hypothetical protein ACK44D_02730 [Bacteroidia bacterium]